MLLQGGKQISVRNRSFTIDAIIRLSTTAVTTGFEAGNTIHHVLADILGYFLDKATHDTAAGKHSIMSGLPPSVLFLIQAVLTLSFNIFIH